MSDNDKYNDLHKAASNVAAILAAIVKMSDAVKDANSPFDAQGKLLFMQKSIQKNAERIVPHIKTILDAQSAKDPTP